MKNIHKFFKGKKVLITGHTGFKGAWLAKTLSDAGARVVGVALPPHTQPNLFTILKLKRAVKNYFLDIRDFKKLKTVFLTEKPEIVFHLAAQAIVRDSFDDPIKTISTNTLGTAHVLEAIRATKSVKAAVIITTDKVYENNEWAYKYRETDTLGGFEPYSAGKAAADIIIQSYLKCFF